MNVAPPPKKTRKTCLYLRGGQVVCIDSDMTFSRSGNDLTSANWTNDPEADVLLAYIKLDAIEAITTEWR